MHRAAERARQLAVGDRRRRHGVDRTLRLWRLDDPAHHLHPVEAMNPREILLSRSERPPTKNSNGSIIRGSAPPDRSSTMPVRSSDHAVPGDSGAMRLSLPVLAELREEVGPGGEDSVIGRSLGVAVVARSRCRSRTRPAAPPR